MEELERCLAALEGSAGADVLARARGALASARQELELHRESAASRAKTGQDWQALAADKETEVVRLRAEIGRMRQALSSTNTAHSSQAEEVMALQAQLDQALALNKAQQRQAVTAAGSAADGPSAELHRLRAELDAATGQLQRAESDLAAQQSAAAARLGEMQDSFIAKIAEIRRTHQQQLEQAMAAARAAAASEANAAAAKTGPRAGAAAMEQQAAQRLQRAEADAIAARQQLEAAQATAAELQAKLSKAQADAEASRSALSSSQFGEKALKARVKDLEAKLAKAQQQPQEPAAAAGSGAGPPAPPPAPPPVAPTPAAPAAPAAPAMDMSMLTMMEGQLGRLSEIIRNREAELGQMRAALQAGLEERRELVQQIEALQGALQQAQAGGGSSGLGSPKSSNSVAGVPVPGGRGLPHVSPNRPYRTGLTSKPKFK
ncbi:hypothetical protein HXX76_003811 [Chlamydomonas incerta]|uniref:Uncharacterized protein n=1 Tax=Chlamydomonas incerta TaxID=51695 RepID=A0A835TCX7_CHLIN|nr:hypothetical protein HXX76_003811 [Chlamydomonas incerta]|eukprot:KAG2440958.1 hypothetical protein HXX76_003811 [Chlamydomonas incerta]